MYSCGGSFVDKATAESFHALDELLICNCMKICTMPYKRSVF